MKKTLLLLLSLSISTQLTAITVQQIKEQFTVENIQKTVAQLQKSCQENKNISIPALMAATGIGSYVAYVSSKNTNRRSRREKNIPALSQRQKFATLLGAVCAIGSGALLVHLVTENQEKSVKELATELLYKVKDSNAVSRAKEQFNTLAAKVSRKSGEVVADSTDAIKNSAVAEKTEELIESGKKAASEAAANLQKSEVAQKSVELAQTVKTETSEAVTKVVKETTAQVSKFKELLAQKLEEAISIL